MAENKSGYTVVMPKLGLIMTEALLVEWRRQDGEWIDKGEVLFTLESDKSTLEIESPASGYVRILVTAGKVVPVQTPIAIIESTLEQTTSLPSVSEVAQQSVSLVSEQVAVERHVVAKDSFPSFLAASPRARFLARKAGISLIGIAGSGPRGMIVANDFSNVKQQWRSLRETESKPYASLSGLRAIIAERLTVGWRERPQATLSVELDASNLVSARQQIELETGRKVSYNAFLMLAVARTFVEQPHVNIRLTEKGLVQLQEINIGLAVDTPRGLMVPVIKNVDKKELLEIDQEIQQVARRALEGKSLPDELTNGSFTITNLGAYGVDSFAPIINPPEIGILAVGRIAQRPFVFNGQLAVRETMILSFAFDHRLLDGAPAARFLQRVVQLIERPILLYSHRFI